MSETPQSDSRQAAGANEPAPDREMRLARAVAEYIDLHAREEATDMEAFCRLHPELAPDLKAQLETLHEMEQILGPEEPTSHPQKVEEPLPERLSGHKILGLIGSGGMGRVLLAADEGLGRKVAIKILSPRYSDNALLLSRFMQEARAMARLNHTNIARIYNLGPSEEIPHFVMEYIEGAPLMEATKVLSLDQNIELMLKVVWAVEFLHQHQVIHRDLKPGNVLVGPDHEPKILDFGLAHQVEESGTRLTRAGEVMGTPDYFSPEQARGEASLDARSDIFSLGAILYQLLTGFLPFRAEKFEDQIRLICEQDPILPRRIDPAIPGELQNICLKALEKSPANRYSSAQEMARDLERFLAGEAVLANPTSYSRMMAGKIEQHLQELRGWQRDHILSQYELDSFKRLYDRLVEREDAWILEVRRLSLSQVTLYLGAWFLVVAAGLVLFFQFPGLSGTPAVMLIAAATLYMAYTGTRCWRQGLPRIAIAFLLAFCLLSPTTILVAMKEWGFVNRFTQDDRERDLFAVLSTFLQKKGSDSVSSREAFGRSAAATFRGATDARVWWALFLSLPLYVTLRRFTRASVFSLVFAVMGALLCLVTLLRMGLLEWVEKDPGKAYFYLLPIAILFFITAAWIERIPSPYDSRYFYPIAVLFIFIGLSGFASVHKPYRDLLQAWIPRTHGHIAYLFIFNALFYLALQSLCERFGSTQMRWVAKWFKFVIPGHVLTSLLVLGLAATERWESAPMSPGLRIEARFFEILLPAAACMFVLGSVPKQMKNFFATGLIFLAVGVIRLQQNWFHDKASWPVGLLATGVILMLLATRYTPIKLAVARWLRRKS